MSKVAVATYNIAYNIANGVTNCDNKPSECGLLLSNPSDNPYYLWDNALINLAKFVNTQAKNKYYWIIGLQEINVNTTDSTKKSIKNITNKLTDLRDKKLLEDFIVSTGSDGLAGAAIIYSKQLGNIEHEKNCKTFTSDGRPVHMVYTKKKILIVNAHLPHRGTLQTYYNALSCQIAQFIQENLIKDYTAIYIVGDFNMNTSSESIKNFKLAKRDNVINKDIILKYNGNLPKSCCFPNPGTKTSPNPYDVFKNTKSKYYSMVGDVVYGSTIPDGNIQIFPGENGPGGRSIESDHELVYQIYNMSTLINNF